MRASLINVTQGENRILIALKEDGEILDRESKIVGKQSEAKIQEIFLIEKPLSPENLAQARALGSMAEKRDFLRKFERPVTISSEAREAI